MKDLLEQLHDIEGLDLISPWPLAAGWWVLIAFAVFSLSAIGYAAVKKLAIKRSWKLDANQKLAALEQNLSEETAREIVLALSEYLRRITLRRFPRKECAALMGDAWLEWLSKHDLKNFDWVNRGKLLIEVPYAPLKLNSKMSTDQVKDLIVATKDWVR